MIEKKPLSPYARAIADRLMRSRYTPPTPPKPKAQVVEWPKPLSQIELCRRQAILDQWGEAVLKERKAFDADAEEAEQRVREFVWGKQR